MGLQLVVIVTVAALLQFLWFGAQVARARGKYGIAAPATSGHEVFERRFRVQMNTQEQLVLFLPVLWMYASFVSAHWAAAFGAVFIVGRAIYSMSYVRDPRTRSVGFMLTSLPTLAMMAWVLIRALVELLRGPAGA